MIFVINLLLRIFRLKLTKGTTYYQSFLSYLSQLTTYRGWSLIFFQDKLYFRF